ncbi:MAG: hypothetical protein V4683_09500 [Bacteroidota bacterium]
MKHNIQRLFSILLLLIATLSLKAQNGYVKFNKDKELEGKRFYKGEIYALLKETKDKLPFYFIAGSDTLNVGTSVDKLQKSPDDKTSLKDNFIKSKDVGLIHIDLSSISKTGNGIRLVSEKFKVTPINTSIDLDTAKFGKSFRLIIPNSPTIYYSLDKLTKFNDANKNIGGAITADNKKSVLGNSPSPIKEESKTSNQIILLSILTLGVIGVILWLFFRRKNTRPESDKEPIYVTYSNHKTLSTFAMDNHINLEKLIRYNSDLIDKKYNRFSQKDRKEVQNSLNNTKLIVGFQEVGASKNDTNFDENEPSTNSIESTNEKKVLENKLKEFEAKKNNIDLTLKQLQSEKATFETKLQTAMAEAALVQNELKELKEKLLGLND